MKTLLHRASLQIKLLADEIVNSKTIVGTKNDRVVLDRVLILRSILPSLNESELHFLKPATIVQDWQPLDPYIVVQFDNPEPATLAKIIDLFLNKE